MESRQHFRVVEAGIRPEFRLLPRRDGGDLDVADIRDASLRPGYTRELARMLGVELGEVDRAVRAARRAYDWLQGQGKDKDGWYSDSWSRPAFRKEAELIDQASVARGMLRMALAPKD